MQDKQDHGLKQAPHAWNERFNQFMLRISFKRCISDQCLYIRNKDTTPCFILLYVDNILLICRDRTTTIIKQLLNSEFEMKDIGEANLFLGMHIKRNMTKGTIS